MKRSNKKALVGAIAVIAIAFGVYQYTASPDSEAMEDALAWDDFGAQNYDTAAQSGRTRGAPVAITAREMMVVADECMDNVRNQASASVEFPDGATVDTPNGLVDLANLSGSREIVANRVFGTARSDGRTYDWSCNISPDKHATLVEIDDGNLAP